jgi:hypothetical protein
MSVVVGYTSIRAENISKLLFYALLNLICIPLRQLWRNKFCNWLICVTENIISALFALWELL